jgi:predicted RNA methylase
VKARYINSKTKKSFLIPIRGLLNLGIVQMGTTKVKALDPKAEVAKVNDYLRNQLMVSLLPTFYVVSVKDRIQESTGNIMYPPYCYQAFSDEIETLSDRS